MPVSSFKTQTGVIRGLKRKRWESKIGKLSLKEYWFRTDQ